MPVKVAFMSLAYLGSVNTVAIGRARVCETLTVPATTTAAALPGEFARIFSTEVASIVCAVGTTPDAAATTATAATTAGFGIAPADPTLVATVAGDRINIKAFV